MLNCPFFSVIVPVYNRSELLPETIDSVLNQEYTNLELLLIDDGSEDNSSSIIKLYSDKDNRIVPIYLKENEGRCKARNEGIKRAKGKWICHLDSDDLYYSDHLLNLYNLINEHPEYKAFAVNQNTNHKFIHNNYKDLTYDKVEWGIERFIFDNPITANQLCFSKKLNIFWADERIPISEDWLFMRNLALRTPILKTSAITVNLRDHDNRTIRFDSNEGLERFVHFNIYAAKKFIRDNVMHQNLKNKIMSHTYLMCANVMLSKKKKLKAMPLILRGFTYSVSYRKASLYKAIFKFIFY